MNAAELGPWEARWERTYRGKSYWILLRRNSLAPLGWQYLASKSKVDRKRFYSEEKAMAMRDKLNAKESTA